MADDTQKKTTPTNDAFDDAFNDSSVGALNNQSDVFVFDPSGDDVMIVTSSSDAFDTDDSEQYRVNNDYDQGSFNSSNTPTDSATPKRAKDVAVMDDEMDEDY